MSKNYIGCCKTYFIRSLIISCRVSVMINISVPIRFHLYCKHWRIRFVKRWTHMSMKFCIKDLYFENYWPEADISLRCLKKFYWLAFALSPSSLTLTHSFVSVLFAHVMFQALFFVCVGFISFHLHGFVACFVLSYQKSFLFCIFSINFLYFLFLALWQ